VGDREITDHQRLSGLGYCFSAALPPYLATAAMGSIDILDSQLGQTLLTNTQENARHLRSSLAKLEGGLLCHASRNGAGEVWGNECSQNQEVLGAPTYLRPPVPCTDTVLTAPAFIRLTHYVMCVCSCVAIPFLQLSAGIPSLKRMMMSFFLVR
jgi:hypothetical protein